MAEETKPGDFLRILKDELILVLWDGASFRIFGKDDKCYWRTDKEGKGRDEITFASYEGESMAKKSLGDISTFFPSLPKNVSISDDDDGTATCSATFIIPAQSYSFLHAYNIDYEKCAKEDKIELPKYKKEGLEEYKKELDKYKEDLEKYKKGWDSNWRMEWLKNQKENVINKFKDYWNALYGDKFIDADPMKATDFLFQPLQFLWIFATARDLKMRKLFTGRVLSMRQVEHVPEGRSITITASGPSDWMGKAPFLHKSFAQVLFEKMLPWEEFRDKYIQQVLDPKTRESLKQTDNPEELIGDESKEKLKDTEINPRSFYKVYIASVAMPQLFSMSLLGSIGIETMLGMLAVAFNKAFGFWGTKESERVFLDLLRPGVLGMSSWIDKEKDIDEFFEAIETIHPRRFKWFDEGELTFSPKIQKTFDRLDKIEEELKNIEKEKKDKPENKDLIDQKKALTKEKKDLQQANSKNIGNIFKDICGVYDGEEYIIEDNKIKGSDLIMENGCISKMTIGRQIENLKRDETGKIVEAMVFPRTIEAAFEMFKPNLNFSSIAEIIRRLTTVFQLSAIPTPRGGIAIDYLRINDFPDANRPDDRYQDHDSRYILSPMNSKITYNSNAGAFISYISQPVRLDYGMDNETFFRYINWGYAFASPSNMLRFGWAQKQLNEIYISPIYDLVIPENVDKCLGIRWIMSQWAEALRDRYNAEIFEADVSVKSGNYLQVGRTFWTPSKEFLYTIKSISHSLSPGTGFATTCAGSYGHPILYPLIQNPLKILQAIERTKPQEIKVPDTRPSEEDMKSPDLCDRFCEKLLEYLALIYNRTISFKYRIYQLEGEKSKLTKDEISLLTSEAKRLGYIESPTKKKLESTSDQLPEKEKEWWKKKCEEYWPKIREIYYSLGEFPDPRAYLIAAVVCSKFEIRERFVKISGICLQREKILEMERKKLYPTNDFQIPIRYGIVPAKPYFDVGKKIPEEVAINFYLQPQKYPVYVLQIADKVDVRYETRQHIEWSDKDIKKFKQIMEEEFGESTFEKRGEAFPIKGGPLMYDKRIEWYGQIFKNIPIYAHWEKNSILSYNFTDFLLPSRYSHFPSLNKLSRDEIRVQLNYPARNKVEELRFPQKEIDKNNAIQDPQSTSGSGMEQIDVILKRHIKEIYETLGTKGPISVPFTKEEATKGTWPASEEELMKAEERARKIRLKDCTEYEKHAIKQIIAKWGPSIDYYARKYEVPKNIGAITILCESAGNPGRRGDNRNVGWYKRHVIDANYLKDNPLYKDIEIWEYAHGLGMLLYKSAIDEARTRNVDFEYIEKIIKSPNNLWENFAILYNPVVNIELCVAHLRSKYDSRLGEKNWTKASGLYVGDLKKEDSIMRMADIIRYEPGIQERWWDEALKKV